MSTRGQARAGATAVTLYGANLEGGTDYGRFGAPHAAGRPGGLRSVYDRSESAPGGVYTWATNHSRLPLEQFMTAATYVPTADLPYAGRRQVFGAGSVVCESPNASVVGPHDGPDDVIALEVALNGQDYTVGLNFSRHAPQLKAVYPTSGPDAGFVIELSGEALTEGTAYRCRFEATYPRCRRRRRPTRRRRRPPRRPRRPCPPVIVADASKSYGGSSAPPSTPARRPRRRRRRRRRRRHRRCRHVASVDATVAAAKHAAVDAPAAAARRPRRRLRQRHRLLDSAVDASAAATKHASVDARRAIAATFTAPAAAVAATAVAAARPTAAAAAAVAAA